MQPPPVTVFDGNRLHDLPVPYPVKEPKCAFHGTAPNGTDIYVPLDDEILSRHILFLGGIGTGKTTSILQVLRQIQLGENDIMIIFDAKGDFLHKDSCLYRPDIDIVISNDDTATGYWNIFGEIERGRRMQGNIVEIGKTLFHEKLEKTNQLFFPNAAKDLFCAVLTHFIRTGQPCNNQALKAFLDSSPTQKIREMLLQHDDFKSMVSYIFDDRSSQTQGVISELQQMSREIFLENFAEKGDISMRELVRNKGGKRVFIEYDLSIGNMLSPVYSLLYDMAIKEALGRKEGERGNVYFITDEFSLIPKLQHVDDAVNFGRGLGVKFMIGIQNVDQMFDNYSEARARSLLSGFLTTVAFRVNDEHSREYIRGIHGDNRKKETFTSAVVTRGIDEKIRDAHVVEDWDIARLGLGQAIIGLPGKEPFVFQFKKA